MASKNASQKNRNLADLANTFQGSDSLPSFSTGNSLPLVARPHGLTTWIPQTGEDRWPFQYSLKKIQGFRATRQPSPWMADYGQFLLATTTATNAPTSLMDTESHYLKADTTARPHLFRVHLTRHEVTAEFSATERAAHFQFTYHGKSAHTWLFFKLAEGSFLKVDKKARTVSGISTANQGGVSKHFGSYFVAHIGTDVLDYKSFKTPVDSPDSKAKDSVGVWLKVKRPANKKIEIKIGTSLISHRQAQLNLSREIGGDRFSQTLAKSKAVWNKQLSVITIEGATQEQLETFYSCLYRTFLFPRAIHETDSKGNVVHYSPHTDKVEPGVLYTDSGFWDVYRTLLPLLTLTAPDKLGEMIQGWVNTYKEGGWLPSWSSPGYRRCMIGSHSTAVIADAYRKGIRNFDIEDAYKAIVQDVTVEPKDPAAGRIGLNDYIKKGYVPNDKIEHSAAATLDYAQCDYAAAAMAKMLGHMEDAKTFLPRAYNYRNLYDKKTKFLRGRLASGKFPEDFDPFDWSRDYIEGSAWQHTWSVPHDAAGLIKLMGGKQKFVSHLNQLFTLPPKFSTGSYGFEIHEMTEMADANFGQYAHSNQPVHHVLFLYSCAERPDLTQKYVRKVMDELYTPNKYPGDEDNGEMSAWYIFNALGLYPLTVGHPTYVLTTPRFPKATIHLANGKKFVIEAKGDVQKHAYTKAVQLNKKAHKSLEISHDDIAKGGTLTVQVTGDAKAAQKRGKTHSAPFSLSDLKNPLA